MARRWRMRTRVRHTGRKWTNRAAKGMGIDLKVMKDKAQWAKARQVLQSLPHDVQMAIDQTVKEEAEMFIELAKRTLVSGQNGGGKAWKPNKPVTLYFKRGNSPLSDTRALANSMYLKREKMGQYRLLFRGGGGRTAQRMHKIAMTHEYGAKIVRKPTEAEMRAIMAKMNAAGVAGERNKTRKKKGYIVIKIPKRPFLRDTKKAAFTGKAFRSRVRNRIRANMVKYHSMMPR